MKLLLVGDPHAKPNELQDCWNLIKEVGRVADLEKPDFVVFLGDLFHTHALIRLEVMSFWLQAFEHLVRSQHKILALVGNHDMSGDSGSSEHALQALESIRGVNVISQPTALNGVLFAPYFHNQEEFILRTNHTGCGTMICHATFDGAQYDNGFYAKDAVSPDLFDVENIISGHIHVPSQFSKVWYPGSPRWQTLSDANIDRHICAVTFNETGKPIAKTPYPTGDVCKRIYQFQDTEEAPLNLAQIGELSATATVCVDLKGTQAWVNTRKEILAKTGCRLRTFCTSTSKPSLRESEGIGVAFSKYVAGFKPPYQTPMDTLGSICKERLGL